MASRPVLLTVDDDPAVSRAVARDLRRRYGQTHRVVRADDGPGALEALRELVLRGQEVAILLADHRMPGMTGVEFLERAMDIVPRAKRVLLTAYADTDAAIRAINDVDLDHYLLKPWDPPEERLYPVLDDLLGQWAATAEPAFEGISLVGHQWSAATQEAKEFLARNAVPYRHLDVRSEHAQRLLTVAGSAATSDSEPDESDLAPADLPYAFLPDGRVLRAPSVRQLAEAAGLATTAGSPFYDVVVIGGGPAGLGSAVYAASEGLRTLLIEQSATGGQAGQSSRIENYLGFPQGLPGAELAQRARDQAVKFEVEILTATQCVAVEPHGEGRTVRFADGAEVTAHAVVLATGVSYTRLPAEGVDDLHGRGIFYGAAAHEAINCKEQVVHVVGAANSAGQAALHLAKYADEVVLLVRGDDLRRSMSEYLVARIEADPRIRVELCTEVIGADGAGHLERLRLRNPDGTHTVDASWLFVFIGAAPRTDWLGEAFARDDHGFVLTGPDLLAEGGANPPGWPLVRQPYLLESSVPGVFVAGDVRAMSVKRVASAVGEGALAVTLIHRYLGAT
ncbi:MAG: Two-component response regulator receiver modulated FAD-dependent pyridine nucleotide-disulfide [Frankiales bacterium]|nr:Two-component response regulator receiver modulated FAD-dependent pyridine nucleotide-disulfide [Frankiales bacterium]